MRRARRVAAAGVEVGLYVFEHRIPRVLQVQNVRIRLDVDVEAFRRLHRFQTQSVVETREGQRQKSHPEPHGNEDGDQQNRGKKRLHKQEQSASCPRFAAV